MFSLFNRKRVPKERQPVFNPNPVNDPVTERARTHPWYKELHPNYGYWGIGPGSFYPRRPNDASHLHLTSSTVLPELPQFGVVLGGRVSGRFGYNPYAAQRDGKPDDLLYDADTLPVFVSTDDASLWHAKSWFASMYEAPDESDFPVVLAMKRNYPMTGANGDTHVSTAPIRSEDISTVFAPPDRVNIAKDLLGSKADTISVQSWPRPSRATQRVMRDGEAGLQWYLRTDGFDLAGG